MKALGLSVLLLAAAAPARADELGGTVEGVARPAYDVVESMTDHVYDALRSYFIGGVLPGRLTRGLENSPSGDSFDSFERTFENNEDRSLERLRRAYPTIRAGEAGTASQLQQWRKQVVDEQVSVLVNSLQDALIDRHRLEAFGQYTGDYAQDRRNWNADFLVPAGVLGTAFLYINGMHAAARVRGLDVALDVKSGMAFRQALNGGSARRLAGLELGYHGNPLKLTADWGLAAGRRTDESVGLRYSLRY